MVVVRLYDMFKNEVVDTAIVKQGIYIDEDVDDEDKEYTEEFIEWLNELPPHLIPFVNDFLTGELLYSG